MKNQADYDAGWTGRTFNPRTGKWSSGGAARAMLVARAGGAQAVQAAGFAAGVEYVAPLLEQAQAQLRETTRVLQAVFQTHPHLQPKGTDKKN